MNTLETDPLDPIVSQTREAREALAARCDHDLEKMAELFRSMQKQHPERVQTPQSARLGENPNV